MSLVFGFRDIFCTSSEKIVLKEKIVLQHIPQEIKQRWFMLKVVATFLLLRFWKWDKSFCLDSQVIICLIIAKLQYPFKCQKDHKITFKWIILPEKCDFHPSQKNFMEKSGGKVSLTLITQMKLPDAIKCCGHNLYIACETLRITSALLEWKNKKQSRNSAVTLIFKQITCCRIPP